MHWKEQLLLGLDINNIHHKDMLIGLLHNKHEYIKNKYMKVTFKLRNLNQALEKLKAECPEVYNEYFKNLDRKRVR